MTPRKEALAFRIWALCGDHGWNLTYSDVARELGVSYQAVSGVCRAKGWTHRLRAPVPARGVDPNVPRVGAATPVAVAAIREDFFRDQMGFSIPHDD